GITQTNSGSGDSHEDDSTRTSAGPMPTTSESEQDDSRPGSQAGTTDDNLSSGDDAPHVGSPSTPVSASPPGTGSNPTQAGAGSASTPGTNDDSSETSSGSGDPEPSASSGAAAANPVSTTIPTAVGQTVAPGTTENSPSSQSSGAATAIPASPNPVGT